MYHPSTPVVMARLVGSPVIGVMEGKGRAKTGGGKGVIAAQ